MNELSLELTSLGSYLQRLCDHLAGQCVGNVLLEGTGGYERAVMIALSAAGIQ